MQTTSQDIITKKLQFYLQKPKHGTKNWPNPQNQKSKFPSSTCITHEVTGGFLEGDSGDSGGFQGGQSKIVLLLAKACSN